MSSCFSFIQCAMFLTSFESSFLRSFLITSVKKSKKGGSNVQPNDAAVVNLSPLKGGKKPVKKTTTKKTTTKKLVKKLN